MTDPKKLDEETIRARLNDLPGWNHEGDALRKVFRFRDFPEAFAFMTRSALFAESSQHHPDWSNVYNQVDVRLRTHDADGITDRDFQLAVRMEEAASSR